VAVARVLEQVPFCGASSDLISDRMRLERKSRARQAGRARLFYALLPIHARVASTRGRARPETALPVADGTASKENSFDLSQPGFPLYCYEALPSGGVALLDEGGSHAARGEPTSGPPSQPQAQDASPPAAKHMEAIS
jgi:hypothetical protein